MANRNDISIPEPSSYKYKGRNVRQCVGGLIQAWKNRLHRNRVGIWTNHRKGGRPAAWPPGSEARRQDGSTTPSAVAATAPVKIGLAFSLKVING